MQMYVFIIIFVKFRRISCLMLVCVGLWQGVEEGDRPEEGFYIRSGITVVLKNATIRDGLHI